MRPGTLVAATLCLLYALSASAKDGVYKSTGHGDPIHGPQRRMDIQPGSCLQCHDQETDRRTTSQLRLDRGLFGPNDDTLCFVCHAGTSQTGAFPGNATWAQSAHALQQASRCTTCHDPHGVRDAAGVIPSLLKRRESALCNDCHDGSRGPDIRSQLTRAFVHGAPARGTHRSDEDGDPSRYAAFPVNHRHVTCSDCHNAHQVIRDPAPSSSDRTNRLAGVSRVQVVNGGAGVVPTYRFVAAADPGDEHEYEICFKCHSSWTKQPAGQPDIARLTNPANPSYHPIQGEGRNARIDPRSFAEGFDVRSIITCSDCHGGDDSVRGPHGSSYRYLLRKSEEEICFECHARNVYVDGSSGSRFLSHTSHAASRIGCTVCHESHGSTRNGALILSGGFPGITTFIQTAVGGSCTSTCHGLQTYSVGYPR